MKFEIQALLRQQAIFRIMGELQCFLGFDEAQVWLNSPREGLEGRTPLEAILSGGEAKVEAIVAKISPI